MRFSSIVGSLIFLLIIILSVSACQSRLPVEDEDTMNKSSLIDAKTDKSIGLLENETQSVSNERENSLSKLRDIKERRRELDLQRSVAEVI